MSEGRVETKRWRVSWLSVLLLAAPLALLGELIIAKTHHRPLGAVTFASVALVSWLVLESTLRRTIDRSWPGSATQESPQPGGEARDAAETRDAAGRHDQEAGETSARVDARGDGRAGRGSANVLRAVGVVGVLVVLARAFF